MKSFVIIYGSLVFIYLFAFVLWSNYSMKNQYLNINIKDVEYLINSYEEKYGTFDKEGYKYVIEQLNFEANIITI